MLYTSPELYPPPPPAIECHSEGGLLQALRELLEEQLLPSHAEATSDDVGLEINKPVIIPCIGAYKSSPLREEDDASYRDSGIAAVDNHEHGNSTSMRNGEVR